MFCCYCEGGCSVQPNKYKTALKRELFVTKRMDTLTDTSRYEVYTWGSSFISSKISSSSSSSRTTFSKTNREIQPAQLWVYPDWKAALRNFVKILPIFPVYHFFRQNIWHAIFDQFHFHCILGDESLENNDSQKQQKDFGDQLNGYQREDLQLFWCTEGDSTNIYILQISISHWGRLSKKLFRGFFSANDLICHSQKFQLWHPHPPPFVLFAHMSKFFVTNIRYFSLNIWVVYGELELDWYVFDQNWAKTIPSHFKIFQIHNASDRPIVQCTNCLKPYVMSHQKTDKPNFEFCCQEIFWYWF